MTLPILLLTPSQSSYTASGAADTKSVQLDGGRPRTSKNVLNGWFTVNVSWLCDPTKHNYLWAFYRTAISKGVGTFQVNLILDNATLQLYTAQFVPQSLSLTAVDAENYTNQAQLMVQPLPTNTEYDEWIIVFYGAYGNEMDFYINAFDQIANVWLPEALG